MKTANGYEPFSWGLNSGAFMNRPQKYHAQEKDDLQTLGKKKKKKIIITINIRLSLNF